MEKDRWIYFIQNAFPAISIFGYILNMPYLFLGIFLALFVCFAILDIFVRRDESYSYDAVIVTPENDGRLSPWLYECATGLYVIVQIIALALGIYFAQYKQPSLAWFLYAIPIGYGGGYILLIAHEYMHKNNNIEKVISRIIASLEFWSVHEYEHLYYHHNADYICTQHDLSHARLNQSFYSYVFYAFISNYRSAWVKQHEISKQNGESFYNIYRNPFLKWNLFSVILAVLILVFVGAKAFAFFLLQALVAIFLFLGATYNQHYGLTRRIKEDGTPEEFTFMNIWSSDHFMTSRTSFNLSHHGHHHLFQLCRYPHLKVVRLGPLLPYGYSTIILISMFPKLWFKIMNPRVEEVFRMRDQYEKEGKL